MHEYIQEKLLFIRSSNGSKIYLEEELTKLYYKVQLIYLIDKRRKSELFHDIVIKDNSSNKIVKSKEESK